MHAFSFIIVIVTFLNLFFNKGKKNVLIMQTAITVFVCTFVNVGYFFESELINIDYYQGAIMLNFLVAVKWQSHKLMVSKSCFRYLVCLLVSFILLIIAPSSTANVTGLSVPKFEYYMTGQLLFSHPVFSKFSIFYLIISICLAFVIDRIGRFFTREDWIHMMVIVARLGKGLLIIVCFEILLKYILDSNLYASFIVGIFGEGTSTYLTIVSRGSFRMLQGLTREASHFTYGMMLLSILLFATEKSGAKKNTGWIIISIVALVLSGAFSMILCIAFLAGYYLVVVTYYNKAGKKIFGKRVAFFVFCSSIIITVFGIAGMALLQSNEYIASRLLEAFDVIGGLGKNDVSYYSTLSHVTSSQTRLYSTYFTIKEWLKRPLFGLGIGTTFCYSNTVLTLAETGIVTVVSMWFFLIKYMEKHCVNIEPCRLSLLLWYGCNILSGIQSRLTVASDVLIIVGCCIALFGVENDSRIVSKKD